MVKYTKSLVTNFSGNLKSEQFHAEIEANIGITANLVGVHTLNDVVDIEFESTLSAGEQTTLDNLISNHIPDTSKPKKQFFIVTPKTINSKNKSYSLIGSFKYPGSISIGSIDYIECISRMDSGITSYDVKIVNKTNNDLVAEKIGMTNTELEAHDLATITNIPATESILEIRARRNGGSGKLFIYIENIIVYYDN